MLGVAASVAIGAAATRFITHPYKFETESSETLLVSAFETKASNL